MTSQLPILLIEDDPGDVRLALSVFRKLHLEERTVVVSDGEEAMDYLYARGKFTSRAPGSPVFILMDLKLPRVNGFELLRMIKATPKFQHIPVVALTSSRQERDVQLAYSLGVNGYVVKSIDFNAYSATLRTVAEFWVGVNEPPPANSVLGAITQTKAVEVVRAGRRGRVLPSLGWQSYLQRAAGYFALVIGQREAFS